MTKMTLKRLASCIVCIATLINGVSSFSPASPPLTSFSSTNNLHNINHVVVTTPSTSSTQLHALPSWTYPLTHILGGATGTPIVIRGTKPGSWYDRIPQPSFNPPNFIFGPVWTTLYGLMGLSLSRILKASSSTTSSAVVKLWYAHYALNLSWAPIFFGLQRFRLGLLISILLVVTLGTILPLYHAIDPLAAYLQLPYMGWLLFATVLNYKFCVLNPVDEKGMNEAMRQKKLVEVKRQLEGYTEERLKRDLEVLQVAAGDYAGL